MADELRDDVFMMLKERFKQEIAGITDIEQLKELYAIEIAKRDKLLSELQEQNKIILQSSLRSKQQQ
jgi:hypothetical protein